MPRIRIGPRGGKYVLKKGEKLYMRRTATHIRRRRTATPKYRRRTATPKYRRRTATPKRRRGRGGCPKGYYRPRTGGACRRVITAKPGFLAKYGYKDIKYLTKAQRMAALNRAIRAQRKSKRAAVMAVKQHLNARANQLVRFAPSVSAKMRSDYKTLMQSYKNIL